MKVMEVQLIVPAGKIAFECAVDVKHFASHAIVCISEYYPIESDVFKLRVIVKDGQVGAWVANKIAHALKQKGYRVTGFSEPGFLLEKDADRIAAV